MNKIIELYKKIDILFTKNEKKQVFKIFLGTVALSFLDIVGITSIVPYITIVSDPEIIHSNEYISFIFDFFEFSSNDSFLMTLGFGIVIFIIMSNGLSAYMNWRVSLFNGMLTHNISTRLLKIYLNMPFVLFLNRNTANMTNYIVIESKRVVGGIVVPTIGLLSKLILVILLFGVLIVSDPIVASIIIFCFGGVYVLIYKFVNNRVKVLGQEFIKENELKLKYATEAMSGIKEVKVYRKQNWFLRRFIVPSKSIALITAKVSIIQSFPRYFIEVFAFAGLIFTVMYMLKIGNSGYIIATIMLYAVVGYRLLPSLQQIYLYITRIKHHIPIVNAFVGDFAIKYIGSTSDDVFKEKDTVFFTDKIEIENVYYKYPKSHINSLFDIKLTINRGSYVGIVGKTGSGKSTLMNILTGLLSPTEGLVKVDGKNMDSDYLKQHKNIGFVPQNVYLIDDSIKNNIAFSSSSDDVSIDLVRVAAKKAGIDSFVMSLSDGYETNVGERGVRLSGGQVQRIGIARSLYHDPDIIMFDEATSSLDSITENFIIDTLNEISHNKTVIMITHRLTTIRQCDLIYLMDDGKIDAFGTYEYLVSNNEKFQRMVNDV
jgi:ABC-type multidrug transport system fused ATPase/permease subunit